MIPNCWTHKFLPGPEHYKNTVGSANRPYISGHVLMRTHHFWGSWHFLSIKKSKKSPTGPTERTPKPEYLIAWLQPCTPLKTNDWNLKMMGTPSSKSPLPFGSPHHFQVNQPQLLSFRAGVRMCNSINVDSISTHTIRGCLVYITNMKTYKNQPFMDQ